MGQHECELGKLYNGQRKQLLHGRTSMGTELCRQAALTELQWHSTKEQEAYLQRSHSIRQRMQPSKPLSPHAPAVAPWEAHMLPVSYSHSQPPAVSSSLGSTSSSMIGAALGHSPPLSASHHRQRNIPIASTSGYSPSAAVRRQQSCPTLIASVTP